MHVVADFHVSFIVKVPSFPCILFTIIFNQLSLPLCFMVVDSVSFPWEVCVLDFTLALNSVGCQINELDCLLLITLRLLWGFMRFLWWFFCSLVESNLLESFVVAVAFYHYFQLILTVCVCLFWFYLRYLRFWILNVYLCGFSWLYLYFAIPIHIFRCVFFVWLTFIRHEIHRNEFFVIQFGLLFLDKLEILFELLVKFN